jgi:putative membrane protein
MTVLVQVLAAIAALLHVGFFLLESVLFTRPPVARLFGATTAERIEHQRLFALNQGFYNLFLAVGAFVGVGLVGRSGTADAGEALVVFTLAVMLAASLVLLASERRMLPAALLQGVVPLAALTIHLVI